MLEEKRLRRTGGNDVSRANRKMKRTLNKKCETQERPRKENKIAIEKSDDDDFESLDNDSDESETEYEMTTRAEDDGFMDVISRHVNFVGDWVVVRFCTKNPIRCISHRNLKRGQTIKQNLLELVHRPHFIGRKLRIKLRIT
jgi:hypothetical protein